MTQQFLNDNYLARVVSVTQRWSVLVKVHQNLKLWTRSKSRSPNASNCHEETEVFLLLLAITSLVFLRKTSLAEYTELAGVAKNSLVRLSPIIAIIK